MRLPFRKIIIAAVVLLNLPVCAFGAASEYRLQGKTMGTTYLIKVAAREKILLAPLQARIDLLLEQINQSMSTYLEGSEISRFNRFGQTNRPFAVSQDFLKVMLAAREIHDLTQGAWDGTVKPLVNLWGFGRSGPIAKVPLRKEICRHWKGSGSSTSVCRPKVI